MALIIEDGSIVVGADSYVTIAELTSYAANRGKTVPDTDAGKEEVLRKGFDYINSKESILKGDRVSKEQYGSYPRYNLWVNGFAYGSDEIPVIVKTLQIELALDSASGIDIFTPNAVVKSEAISGAVSVTYADGAGSVAIRQSSLLFRQLSSQTIGINIER